MKNSKFNLLLILCLFVPIVGLAQTSKKLDLSLKEKTLREFFQTIESKTEYSFMYNNIDLDQTVNIDVKQTSLDYILKAVLTPKSLTYEVRSRQILIKKAQTTPSQNQLTRTITGIVADGKGEPIIGANVIEGGTQNGVITDINGSFSLQVSNNAVIKISYLGYTDQTISTSKRSTFNITLEEDSKLLDEVVVIGYGTMKKKDLTGAINHVDAEKLAYERPATIQDLIRSTAPGLNVDPSSSAAKEQPKFVIRGQRSLNGGINPLIVLNGVPFNGDLLEINPADVESIDVLKDASSAAIYGAKSANGVIIITTKKGKGEKPTVKFDGSIGFATMGNDRKVYDPKGFLKYRSDYAASSNGFDKAGYYYKPTPENLKKYNLTEEQWRNYDALGQGSNNLEDIWIQRIGLGEIERKNYFAGKTYDWYDASWQTALRQNYNVSLSGQTSNVNYYWSLGYQDNEGNTVGDRFKNYRTNLRLDAKVTDFLEVGVNLFLQVRDESFQGVNFTAQMENPPYTTPYNEDGSLTPWPMGQQHSVPSVNSKYNLSMSSKSTGLQNATTDFYAKLKLPFNISYQFTFAPRYSWYQNRYWSSSESLLDLTGGSAMRETARSIVWTLDNMVKWNYTFANKHSFDVTLLQSAEKYEFWQEKMEGKRFSPTDILQWHYMQAANDKTISSNDEKYTGDALMARLFYSYDNRYMLTASVRRDGFSAFGRSNPRASFPALALAWNFTNEKFFQWEPMSSGKLRVSWGKNGNREIGFYQALAQLTGSGTYSYVSQNGTLNDLISLQISRMSNNDLKWESTGSWNLGLDFGFLNNRINGSIEWYHMPTTDLLMDRSLPNISGYASVITNLGKVTNEGFEVSLNTQNIEKKNFTWSTTFGLSHNKNRINHLYYTYEDILDENGKVVSQKETDDIAKGWFIGKDISTIWDYEFIGIWQEEDKEEAAKYGQKPGDAKARDVNNDYKITQEDRVFLGQKNPKFRWSLRNDFRLFENWDFSFNFYASMGHKQATTDYLNAFGFTGDYNNTFIRGYWTPENRSNSYARLKSTLPSNIEPKKILRKDFIRLENISIGYKVPRNIAAKLLTQDIRLYGTIRNVAILKFEKEWDYWDIETTGTIPRTFTLGASITF